MATKLSRFTTALQRLVSWPGNAPAPDLPPELIFQEILPYLRNEAPTSLAGLQVALTCKAFHHALYPLIARFFVDRLVEAYPMYAKLDISLGQSASAPRMNAQEFEGQVEAAFMQSSLDYLGDSSSRNVGAFDSPFQMTCYVHLGLFDDIDFLWALNGLLSKPSVSRFLHSLKIVLVENGALNGNTGEQRLVNASANDKWKRAFVKLIDVAVEPEGVELHLTSLPSSNFSPKASLGRPLSPSVPFLGSRLHKLTSTSGALNLFWHCHLSSLIKQSSHTLTHLHIGSSDTPEAKWHSMLPAWHLPMLESFEMDAAAIPLTSLISFLLLNPSIFSATIFMPPDSIPPRTRVPGMLPQDYPRFLPRLRRLAATTDLLLALFTPWPNASHPDIPLRNLESLTIVHRPTIDYDEISRVLLYASGSRDGEQSRTTLQAIAVEIPYAEADAKAWLGSVSPAVDLLDSIDVLCDGLMLSTTKSAVQAASGSEMSSTRPDLTTILSSLTQISSFGLKMVVTKPNPFTRMVLSRPYFALDPHTITCFMAALPAVKEVVLDGLFCYPWTAVKDAAEFWVALGSMWLACGSLEKLEIRGLGGSTTPAIWNFGDVEPNPGLDFWSHAFVDTTNE